MTNRLFPSGLLDVEHCTEGKAQVAFHYACVRLNIAIKRFLTSTTLTIPILMLFAIKIQFKL